MRAFVLAGGLGTRLSRVVKDRPKSMAIVAGVPFLEHLLRNLQRHGVVEVVLLTGHLHEAIEKYFGNGKHFGLDIRYSRERTPLGTGGALRFAFENHSRPSEEVLIMNGDTYFDIETAILSSFHLAQGAILSLALKYMTDASRYGKVILDHERIVGFTEKTASIEEDGLINGGIYIASASLADHLTSAGTCSLETEVIPRMVAEGNVCGLPFSGRFIDIGVPEDYHRAEGEIGICVKTRKKRAVFLDRDNTLIKDKGYTWRQDELELVAGAPEFLRRVSALGYELFIVTNQSGVARGLYTERDVAVLMQTLLNELAKHGVFIRDYAYCPYHPEGSVAEYRKDSYLRKPKPGMILDLADRYSIDLEKSCMIGDSQSDMIELPYLRSILLPSIGRFEEAWEVLEEGCDAV